MLTETEITLTFPMGAGPFRQSPSLFIYRQVLRLIHQISCMNSQSRCKECPLHSDCRYYWITGSHFNGYSGIVCPASPFEKRKFEPREELTIRIYWIGTAGDFAPMTDAALSRMEQTIMGSFFYLKGIRHKVLEEEMQHVHQIHFLTPPQLEGGQNNPNEEFQKMNGYFSRWYQANFRIPRTASPILSNENPGTGLHNGIKNSVLVKEQFERKELPETEQYSAVSLLEKLLTEQSAGMDDSQAGPFWKPGVSVEGSPVSLGTRKLCIRGNVGTLLYPETETISSYWSLIGLGKTNCIGGGQFETDHTI